MCFLFYTRGCGCIGRPAFPTPFVGRKYMHDSGVMRRENADVYPRHCEERKRRSNPRFVVLLYGLLRSARNDELGCLKLKAGVVPPLPVIPLLRMATERRAAMLRHAGSSRHILKPFVDHPRAHIGRRLADHADRPDLIDQQFPDFLRDLRALFLRLAGGASQQFKPLQQLRIGLRPGPHALGKPTHLPQTQRPC